MSITPQTTIENFYSRFSPQEGETIRQITVNDLIIIANFGHTFQLFYHPPGELDLTPQGKPKLYLHMRNWDETTNRSEIVDLTNSLTLELGTMGISSVSSEPNAIKITLYDPDSNTIMDENDIFLSVLREPRFTFFISNRENGEFQVKQVKPARTRNPANNPRRIPRRH